MVYVDKYKNIKLYIYSDGAVIVHIKYEGFSPGSLVFLPHQ